MKKPNQTALKLRLSAHTVRALVQPQLTLVAGGVGGSLACGTINSCFCKGTSSDPCTQ
jgi:hypothetical protein